MNSYYAKQNEIQRNWVLIDLKDKVLGRTATQIASILKGKTKPTYTPAVDMGDFVVCINASKIILTGNKLEDKKYYKHTGYMGGMKATPAKEYIKKDPAFLITTAVKGMLPRGPLGRKLLGKLKVYAGAEHPHAAQKPQEIN